VETKRQLGSPTAADLIQKATRTKHGNGDSTIDYVWATDDLRIKYEGLEEYKLSEQKLQIVHIELEALGR
jgi:hypothetical protein